MRADKVAMRIQQQVSGIRVEVLNRGYGELEELRVVFDRIDPYPWLVDKVVGLMEKHSFYNTHASDDGGDFKMVFARATSLGIGQLERMARKSRAEIRQEAKRRVGARNEGLAGNCVKLCPASRAILTALMNAGGVMTVWECFHAVTCGEEIEPNDFACSLLWLYEHKFVVFPNRSGVQKVQLTRSGLYDLLKSSN